MPETARTSQALTAPEGRTGTRSPAVAARDVLTPQAAYHQGISIAPFVLVAAEIPNPFSLSALSALKPPLRPLMTLAASQPENHLSNMTFVR